MKEGIDRLLQFLFIISPKTVTCTRNILNNVPILLTDELLTYVATSLLCELQCMITYIHLETSKF